MIPNTLLADFSEQQELLVLEYFDRLNWGFQFGTIYDIITPKNIQEILMAVDYDYFEKIDFSLSKTNSMPSIIKTYMHKILKFNIDPKIEKQLIANNEKTWIAVILYLFGNCEQKMIFIQEMMQCSEQAQQTIMLLMGQVTQKGGSSNSGSETKLNVNQEIQNQLKQKDLQLNQMARQLERLEFQNMSLRQENQKLTQALSEHITQKSQQLQSVNASTLQELIALYKDALKVNQRLNSKIQRVQDQNFQLNQLYSGVSHDLSIAKQQNEQKDTALRTRVSSTIIRKDTFKGLKFVTNSDSDQQISYRQSIDMHTKPLKEQLGSLGRYSNNLKLQMRMLFNEFQRFTQQLKPLKDQGMFEDVPRSVF